MNSEEMLHEKKDINADLFGNCNRVGNPAVWGGVRVFGRRRRADKDDFSVFCSDTIRICEFCAAYNGNYVMCDLHSLHTEFMVKR